MTQQDPPPQEGLVPSPLTDAEIDDMIVGASEEGRRGFLELRRARARIKELLDRYQHYHQAGHRDNIDKCRACGFDLRHDIHIRGGLT